MKFQFFTTIKRSLCVLAACVGFATAPALAQTIVASKTEQTPGSVDVVFSTTAGKNYRIEHSNDLTNWTFYPDSIYGLNQTVRYHVYDAPIPVQGPPLPPSNDPRPSEYLFFHVTGFNDGSAVAEWRGKDGSAQKAYLASFNLVYLNKVMSEDISGTRVPTPPALPFRLDIWSWGYSSKDPAVVNMQASATEAATLAKLTSQYAWVYGQMKDRVDWRAANPGPPPSPPKLFDDRGQPLRHYFRVREYTIDSNFDGIPDHLQFGNGGNPFNMDNDGDGIPNGYDKDIWPNDPALNSVLINEVLYANEFTNADQDGTAQDWIELYNPTNATISVGSWYLSAKSSNRTQWTIPAGTTIASGQFLVIWASGKNLTATGAAFHTSFSIKNGATSPALVLPEPVYLSKTNPAGGAVITVDSFVPQTAPTGTLSAVPVDVSYGRYATATGLQFGYFVLPTPGAALSGGRFGGAHNVQGALGVADPPTFSGAAPGLYTGATLSAQLVPPASGGIIHFTTNAAVPTRYSEIYSEPITVTRTKVVSAITAKDGYLPSSPLSRSFLFTEDIVGTAPAGTVPTDHQGARDANNQFKGLLFGYPEPTHQPDFPLEYGMNPNIIKDHKAEILSALAAYPIVSVTTSIPTTFDVASGGVYANSEFTDSYWESLVPDPYSHQWQRLCTFSYLPNGTGGAPIELNACLSVTGGSSLNQQVTRKHNWRIKFASVHGPSKLDYPLFSDNPSVHIFDSLHLKNPTHDSWSQNFDGWGDLCDEATYCDEGWSRSAHVAMGADGPRRKWVNMFINGIYWGPHELTERVDADFMKNHYGTGAPYDVLKQFGAEVIDGDQIAWNELLTRCRALRTAVQSNQPAATQQALYAQVEDYLDVDNFVDYLICNTYAGNTSDWPGNNYRMGRRKAAGSKFKFFVWDSEWAFRTGEQSDDVVGIISSEGEVVEPNAILQSYVGYRQRFAQRLKKHFFVVPGDATSGCLAVVNGTDRAVSLYQAEMAKVEPLLWCESARWGSLREDSSPSKLTPYLKSDPVYLPGNPTKGDWTRATNNVTQTWLPQKRAAYFSQFAAANLFVNITPATLPNGNQNLAYSQALTATGGTSPRAFSIVSGTLPAGISLTGSSLTGTPTAAGSFNFQLGATSADGIVGMRQYTLTIAP